MAFHNLEIRNFLKANIFKILIGTIIFTIFYVAIMDVLFPRDGVRIVSYNYSTTMVKPAAFQFYIEDKNDNSFTDEVLLKEHLLSDNVLRSLSKQSPLDMEVLNEASQEHSAIKIDNYSQTFGLNRNQESNLIELYINVGNEVENIQLADLYYKYINTETPSILQDKELHVFTKPTLKYLSEEANNKREEQLDFITDVIVANVTVGISLGIPIILFLLILKSFFKPTLETSLSYFVKQNDNCLLINRESRERNFITDILFLLSEQNVALLVENTHTLGGLLDENHLTNLHEKYNLSISHSISEFPNWDEVDRVVYIIKNGETSRNWYNKQRKIERSNNIETYIVHIN